MLSKVQIKTIHALQHKKYRQKSRRFLAEGIKVTEELLQSPMPAVETVYGLPSGIEKLSASGNPMTAFVEITENELKNISCLTTPQEVVAICKMPEIPDFPDLKDKITLMLEAIRDPGNLGTIIRIADWFGISQITCSSDCVDTYNPKTIQATMGSIARVKVWSGNLPELLQKNKTVSLYATTLEGKAVTDFQKMTAGIIAIGNESAGLSAALIRLAQERITIPRIGKAESLNAAVATGIICGQLLL